MPGEGGGEVWRISTVAISSFRFSCASRYQSLGPIASLCAVSDASDSKSRSGYALHTLLQLKVTRWGVCHRAQLYSMSLLELEAEESESGSEEVIGVGGNRSS